MKVFIKPIVVISKCITFENVRWNIQIIASDFVEKPKPFVDFISVCPEVEIWLGVPRNPLAPRACSCQWRKETDAAGSWQISPKKRDFAESFLSYLREVDGFILKSGSPSNGFKNVKIYPTIGKPASIARGPGFFGRVVIENFPSPAIEDEKRLLNSRIGEHFLTKFSVLAGFREVKKSVSIFHYLRIKQSCKRSENLKFTLYITLAKKNA